MELTRTCGTLGCEHIMAWAAAYPADLNRALAMDLASAMHNAARLTKLWWFYPYQTLKWAQEYTSQMPGLVHGKTSIAIRSENQTELPFLKNGWTVSDRK